MPLKCQRKPSSIAKLIAEHSTYGTLHSRETISAGRGLLSYIYSKPMDYEEAYDEPCCKAMPEEEVRKPILQKGDRVILTTTSYGSLGPGSEGIVLRDVYGRYNSVPVDFVRAHNRLGQVRRTSWTGGHRCDGLAPVRNGHMYGHWIDAHQLKKVTNDDDILLLI